MKYNFYLVSPNLLDSAWGGLLCGIFGQTCQEEVVKINYLLTTMKIKCSPCVQERGRGCFYVTLSQCTEAFVPQQSAIDIGVGPKGPTAIFSASVKCIHCNQKYKDKKWLT